MSYMQVFLALAMAAIGVSQSSTLTLDSSKAKSAASSIFAIVDRKSRIDPSEDAGVTVETLRGNIEFQHVSFRYPTRPDVQIFRDLCLTIHAGKASDLLMYKSCIELTMFMITSITILLFVFRLLRLLERVVVANQQQFHCFRGSMTQM